MCICTKEKFLLVAIIWCFLSLTVFAQKPAIMMVNSFFGDSGLTLGSSVKDKNENLLFWTLRNQQLALVKVEPTLQAATIRAYPTTRKPVAVFGMVATNDGGCAAVFQQEEGNSFFSSNIMQISGDGETLWKRNLYTLKAGVEIRLISQVLQCPDGSLIVTGFFENNVLINKVGVHGDSIWFKKLDYKGARGPVVPCLTSHGTFVFNVTHVYSEVRVTPGSGVEIIYTLNFRIVEMDFDGNVIDEHLSPDTEHVSYLSSLAPSMHGGYIGCGAQTVGESLRHLIVRINDSGAVVWNTTFKTFSSGTYESIDNKCMSLDLMELDDSTILVGGGDQTKSQMVAMALNSKNGDRIWTQTLPGYVANFQGQFASSLFLYGTSENPVIAYQADNKGNGISVCKYGKKFPPSFISNSLEMSRTVSANSVYIDTLFASDTFPIPGLTFTLDSISPATMTISNSTGVLMWRPQKSDTGMNTVTVVVSDQAGQCDTLSYTINVTSYNVPPVFVSPTKNAIAFSRYSFVDSVMARDEDSPILSYSLVKGPQGVVVDPLSGVLSWLPNETDIGIHEIVLDVHDGNLSDSMLFTIQVYDSVPIISRYRSVSTIPTNSCSFVWKFDDKAVLAVTSNAMECQIDTMTIKYLGFSTNSGFQDVGGYFFEIESGVPFTTGSIKFSHPDLHSEYILAVKKNGEWVPQGSSMFSPDEKSISANIAEASSWVAIDHSVFTVGKNSHLTDVVPSIHRCSGMISIKLPRGAKGKARCTVLNCKGAVVHQYVFHCKDGQTLLSLPTNEIGIKGNNVYILIMEIGLQRIVSKVMRCD